MRRIHRPRLLSPVGWLIVFTLIAPIVGVVAGSAIAAAVEAFSKEDTAWR